MLNQEAIIWDAHTCVPLLQQSKLEKLLIRHHKAGFHFASINIGMDMIPSKQTLELLNIFRAEIASSQFLRQAHSISDIVQAKKNRQLAVAFDIEGASLFLESSDMVERLHRLGVKQALLAYNRNNRLAGGCFDSEMSLTAKGKDIISAMSGCGMIIDCAHMGYRSSMDVMEYADSPVIFSHANVSKIWQSERNLRDEQIKACAQTGGVVCVSGLSWLLGLDHPKVECLVQHIDYIASLVGIDHVGIGLDYVYDDHVDDLPEEVNMQYWWPNAKFTHRQFSCSFLPPEEMINIKKLLYHRYSRENAQKILGENMLKLATTIWKTQLT